MSDTTAGWLKEQAQVQQTAATAFYEKLDDDAKFMANFIVAMSSAHMFNALSVVAQIVLANQHLEKSALRREQIAEDMRSARRAAARGFDTGDWTEFDALVASTSPGSGVSGSGEGVTGLP